MIYIHPNIFYMDGKFPLHWHTVSGIEYAIDVVIKQVTADR